MMYLIYVYLDLNELQTFVDVAYTTATGDDELNILKLNSLRFIGNALANFTFVLKDGLPPTDDINKDRSHDLIELCHGLWDLLEQNSNLPSLMVKMIRNFTFY